MSSGWVVCNIREWHSWNPIMTLKWTRTRKQDLPRNSSPFSAASPNWAGGPKRSTDWSMGSGKARYLLLQVSAGSTSEHISKSGIDAVRRASHTPFTSVLWEEAEELLPPVSCLQGQLHYTPVPNPQRMECLRRITTKATRSSGISQGTTGPTRRSFPQRKRCCFDTLLE